jgi:hypothetical protein
MTTQLQRIPTTIPLTQAVTPVSRVSPGLRRVPLSALGHVSTGSPSTEFCCPVSHGHHCPIRGVGVAWSLSPPMEAYLSCTPKSLAKSCSARTGRINEKSSWPASPVQFGRDAIGPYVHASMEHQLANGESTTQASLAAEFHAKAYPQQPSTATTPTVGSDGPPPLGAGLVSDPTLVGSRVQMSEPRWDPMLDVARIAASATMSGFVCHSPADATLIVVRETVVDQVCDPISVELEATASPINPPCNPLRQHPRHAPHLRARHSHRRLDHKRPASKAPCLRQFYLRSAHRRQRVQHANHCRRALLPNNKRSRRLLGCTEFRCL